ncbi:flavin reductase family protein, partial [Vibrio parahaemolyticus]|uniref:flavin reductase family protein n=1 Tax=Vibrio parahaemolyticus TaxID=670 RepID=UPI0021115C45
ADRFAGRHGVSGAARFEGASWTALVTGTPVLATALATLDCRVEEVIERHSHAIVIGEVVAIGVRDQGAALAYWRGNYVALDNEEEAARL